VFLYIIILKKKKKKKKKKNIFFLKKKIILINKNLILKYLFIKNKKYLIFYQIIFNHN